MTRRSRPLAESQMYSGASFGPEGITIIDPYRVNEGPEAVFERIYTKPI